MQRLQRRRNTIRLWLKRERETGDFQALPNQPPGNGHKITDWEKFTKFVEVNGDKTQVEMAQLWTEKISERTISRGLKKIGFTRKKKLMVTALCVTKRYSNSSEQNNFRFAYLNIISHPIPIVFPQSVHFEVQIS